MNNWMLCVWRKNKVYETLRMDYHEIVLFCVKDFYKNNKKNLGKIFLEILTRFKNFQDFFLYLFLSKRKAFFYVYIKKKT